jgi:phosphatidylinositol dimannoside acyltransferase
LGGRLCFDHGSGPLPLLKTGYLLAARAARATPARARRSLSDAGGLAWYALMREQAANVRRNYAAVLGVSEHDPAARRLARQAFKNYARMIEDFVLIGAASRDEVMDRLTYTGREHVDAALAGGRGCILALPHAGSWDVAGCVAAIMGYPIVAVARTFPGSLDETVTAGRGRFGLKVIPLGHSAVRELEQALGQNMLAALLCDILHGRHGVAVDLFGRSVQMPAGPAALALRTGATLLPVGVACLSDGRYRAEVDRPAEIAPSGDRRLDAARLMQVVADSFSRFIARHPDSWYAFRPLLRDGALELAASPAD